jgi:hypothetical protein
MKSGSGIENAGSLKDSGIENGPGILNPQSENGNVGVETPKFTVAPGNAGREGSLTPTVNDPAVDVAGGVAGSDGGGGEPMRKPLLGC